MASDHTQRWIRRTIELAKEARDRGDEPFGAILVRDGDCILEARNAVNTERDVTQHAELRLISKACRTSGVGNLLDSVLYTSTEPCAMCAGAIYWAGVGRIVFGMAASSLEEMTGGSGLRRPSRQVLGNASRIVDIEGPVLESEARSVHEGFW